MHTDGELGAKSVPAARYDRSMAEAATERYFAAMAEEESRAGNLRFSIQKRFEGIDFSGRAVLDIGAGAGGMSFYAAVAGAARVVALEPEAAGSSRGVRSTFERRSQQLGVDQVFLRPETLQEFDPGDQRFDVIISMASINHLDEAACKELHRDPEAHRVYREILGKLAEMAAPGADLVVSDCARRNVFPTWVCPTRSCARSSGRSTSRRACGRPCWRRWSFATPGSIGAASTP